MTSVINTVITCHDVEDLIKSALKSDWFYFIKSLLNTTKLYVGGPKHVFKIWSSLQCLMISCLQLLWLFRKALRCFKVFSQCGDAITGDQMILRKFACFLLLVTFAVTVSLFSKMKFYSFINYSKLFLN